MIIVDIPELIDTTILEAMDDEAINQVVGNVAESARNHWIKLAGEELNSSRRDYINGIQDVVLKSGIATLALVGRFPNLIEHGMDELDMRGPLLGPKVPVAPFGKPGKRETADGLGYYRAVPFRHAAPTSGSASGTPMGSQYTGHSAVKDAMALGRAVYRAAKKLDPTTSDPYAGSADLSADPYGGKSGISGTKYGGRLDTSQVKYRGKKVEIPILSTTSSQGTYTHKSNLFEGMIREEKTYAKATQSQYVTFRTISTRVTEGWIRPASQGKFLGKQVAAFAGDLAPKAFAAYVASLK